MTTNALDSLLGRIDDAALRLSIEREVEQLRSTKDFGLVFERHLPEQVRLLSYPIRRGVQVQDRLTESEETWVVASVKSGVATLIDSDGESSERPVDELVVIRGFGDPIYPGLTSVGKVEQGGDKPFHAVIKGENFYVLETLLYAHEGQVDAIYIDPPYNSGARDWKYNNDFVDGEDAYRHSKWLSFMEKRLLLAKRLLNPENSVLIVTIDEKEYLRLGLLLEQVFSDCDIQMISSVINPSGSSRSGRFGRSDEYVFFVFIGESTITPWSTDMLRDVSAADSQKVRWNGLIRNGEGSRRSRIPSLFYPIFINKKTGKLHSVGEPLAPDAAASSVVCPAGTLAILPIDGSGQELMWRLHPPTLRDYLEKGYAKLGRRDDATGMRSPQYLQRGTVAKLKAGDIEVLGKDSEGALDLRYKSGTKTYSPLTLWNRVSHSAAEHGSAILKAFIPGRKFPYPKRVYAVEDCLRFVVKDKPHALIVDFFGGSGTTTHAVARLNRQDDGERRSIVVTNNEVSEDEAKALRKAGHYPGQPEWEALGIFEHITKPRVTAAITGKTPEGKAVAGDYKFTDVFPMAEGFAENVEFFELTYMDKDTVARGKAFEAIAPVLWMRFGAGGAVIAKQTKTYAAPADARYAVLFDVNQWQSFVDAIRDRDDLLNVCIVTDSIAQFQQVVAELPEGVGATMLYEDYLRNFEINTGATA